MLRVASLLTVAALSVACRADVLDVAAADRKACALYDDRRVRCWGLLEPGDDLVPEDPASRDLEVGTAYQCVLQETGAVSCWGWEVEAPPEDRFVDIGVGDTMACGVREDASLVCWGCPEIERFEPRTCTSEDRFGRLSPPAGEYVSVSCRDDCCAVRVDGSAICWGETSARPDPASRFVDVRVASANACGVTETGRIECWQRGTGGVATANPPDGAFRQIDLKFRHGCGVRDDATLVCWGEDDDVGKTIPPEGDFLDVTVAVYNSCAITTEHELRCWGSEYTDVLDIPE